MEAASLWAGVRFTARNGSPEALLTDAAGQGLHLYGIFSLPGGFYGHCAAWQYRRLAALARHRRVRLRVEKRKGLYFLLRPLLRRKGLWTGLVAWGLVLLWLQKPTFFPLCVNTETITIKRISIRYTIIIIVTS